MILMLLKPLFKYHASQEDYLLWGTDGGPHATAYNVMETANIGLRLLVAVEEGLVSHGGQYGCLRAQAVTRQLRDAGLAQAAKIFRSIKRYGLLALGELFQGLFPVRLEEDMMKRILGYMGYPAQPQLDPLGPHYYVAGGAWGEAWSGLETPEMRSNLLGLYRLGDRLAGKIHKVIFATPSLNLDGIHKVAQGELMGQGRREK